jgi:hypothetical protein
MRLPSPSSATAISRLPGGITRSRRRSKRSWWIGIDAVGMAPADRRRLEWQAAGPMRARARRLHILDAHRRRFDGDFPSHQPARGGARIDPRRIGILLEAGLAWEAIENAGWPPTGSLAAIRANSGVFRRPITGTELRGARARRRERRWRMGGRRAIFLKRGRGAASPHDARAASGPPRHGASIRRARPRGDGAAISPANRAALPANATRRTPGGGQHGGAPRRPAQMLARAKMLSPRGRCAQLRPPAAGRNMPSAEGWRARPVRKQPRRALADGGTVCSPSCAGQRGEPRTGASGGFTVPKRRRRQQASGSQARARGGAREAPRRS